ncbi:MAG: aminopeptidase P family protein [Acidobacteria bacterium]|nr:aminopeptidase P family protein [Acidobacteriota bacterium]
MNGERLGRLRDLLVEARVEGLIVSALPNIRYLTGFTGSNALALVTRDDTVFFTDGRYKVQASLEVRGAKVIVAKASLVRALMGSVKRRGLRRLAFERRRASFELYDTLRRGLKGCRLQPLAGAVEKLRAVKSAAEIAIIRRAAELNSKVFETSLREIRPGRAEAEVAARIEYNMRKLGAEKPAFETIVASGARSALPHARPTHKLLTEKELIIIDQGVILDGYSSDMTRTVAVGDLGRRAKRVYQAVLEAQLAAIAAVRAGVKARDVDRQARITLEKHGLEETFVHSTGHGVGLEIHEAPRLGRSEKVRLEAGMVITIEPGAYLGGFGGVRIEDMVVVTERGCEVLTPTPKDLRVL